MNAEDCFEMEPMTKELAEKRLEELEAKGAHSKRDRDALGYYQLKQVG